MPDPNEDHVEMQRLAQEDPHPIGKSSLYERMSAIQRGERPSPLDAARAHLGTVDAPQRIAYEDGPVVDGGFSDSAVDMATSAVIEHSDPLGSVEQAMMAGADLETGELPREESFADRETDRIIEEQGGLAAVHVMPPAAVSNEAPAGTQHTSGLATVTSPPPAAETASVSSIVQPDPAPELAAPAPPPPERQTFNSAPPPPVQPAPVETVQAPQRAGQAPQEVIEPERAADGTPAPFAARDAGQLINMLENGQLSADIIAAMTALTQGMSEIAEGTGKKQKGTLTIKIKLSTDDTGEAFFVNGEFSVLAPKVERRKTLLWPDEKGHLSPSQPRQRVFFGVRDAGGGPRQIRDATAERRSL